MLQLFFWRLIESHNYFTERIGSIIIFVIITQISEVFEFSFLGSLVTIFLQKWGVGTLYIHSIEDV